MQQAIFATSLLGSKTVIFKDRIVYKQSIFSGEQIIPINKIASVGVGMAGAQQVTIETAGGKRHKMIVRLGDKKQIIDLITKLINGTEITSAENPLKQGSVAKPSNSISGNLNTTSTQKKIPKGLKIAGLVAVGLLFFYVSLPAMIIWYIWKKKKLNQNVRIVVTILLAAFAVVSVAVIYLPKEEPVITITEPKNNTEIQAVKITVTGTVKPFSSDLTINDSDIILKRGGAFSHEVELDKEETIINLVAKNGNKKTTQSITVKRIFTADEKAEIEKQKAAEEQKRKETQKQLELKVIEETKQQLQKELDNLKTFDTSKFRGSQTGLQLEVAVFSLWAEIIEKHDDKFDPEVKSLVNTLKRKVAEMQNKEFPLMRKHFAELMAKNVWEENVEVNVKDARNKTLELTGGVFANNKNIAEAQNSFVQGDLFKYLRFTSVNYKWYKYDDEFTYFSIDSPADNAPVKIEK